MNPTRLLTILATIALAGGCATAPRAAAPVGAAVDLAGLDQIPVARFMARPEVPYNLRAPGSTGSAVVAFIVDADGNVRDPQVVQATRPEYGIAAVQAVSQWKFRPGRKGGRNVNVLMRVPIVFDVLN